MVVVFNTTFNHVQVVSWLAVLLVVKTIDHLHTSETVFFIGHRVRDRIVV
jgi:hypothetical protein